METTKNLINYVCHNYAVRGESAGDVCAAENEEEVDVVCTERSGVHSDQCSMFHFFSEVTWRRTDRAPQHFAYSRPSFSSRR